MKIFILIYCFIFCNNVLGNSLLSNLNVTIAVVEYSSVFPKNVSDEDITLQNANQYVDIINKITDTDLNMIIFPECTLTSNISVEIVRSANPCESRDYPEFMKILSCAAKNKTIYIIVNLNEKSYCVDKESGCPSKGYYVYNTDVIFDSSGIIIERYRKYNLFGEYNRDKPDTPDKVTFQAFGLKFGIFTCFDILFKTPTQDLIDDGIDAAIFPTMWFSELPFLTAVQAQQMWSQTHDTILFAAGANDPAVGSGGTGVYNGAGGAIGTEILGEGGTVSFVSKVISGNFQKASNSKSQDIEKLSSEMDKFFLKTDDSLPDFSSQLLNTSSSEISKKVCYENSKLCCNFNISLTKSVSETNQKNVYYYHLVAFSGIRSFTGVYNGGIDLCGVIACINSSLSGCGLRFSKYDEVSWPLTFERIQISAQFENNENKTQYPNSLLSSILPIDVTETTWTKNEVDGGFIERTFVTTKSQNRLLTFAIYGRDFRLDSPPKKDDGSSSVNLCGVNVLLLLLSVTITFLFKK